MRSVGSALKLRMELGTHHEGMIFDFHNLHQSGLGPFAGENKSLFFEFLPERIIEFVTVPVALRDLGLSIRFVCFRPLPNLTAVRPKTECSAFGSPGCLTGKEMNHILAV